MSPNARDILIAITFYFQIATLLIGSFALYRLWRKP